MKGALDLNFLGHLDAEQAHQMAWLQGLGVETVHVTNCKPQQAEAIGTAALTAAAKGACRHLARHAFLCSMVPHGAACAASSGWPSRQLIMQMQCPWAT